MRVEKAHHFTMVRHFALAVSLLASLAAASSCDWPPAHVREVLSPYVVEQQRLFELDPIRSRDPCLREYPRGSVLWRDNYIPVRLRVNPKGAVRVLEIGGVDENGRNLVTEDCVRLVRIATRTWRYAPFGAPDYPETVEFTEQVLVAPPEIWSETRIPFPEHYDLSTARITLVRGGCYRTCPSYSVELDVYGFVRFDGWNYVKEIGPREGRIDPAEFTTLLGMFRDADFLSLRGQYRYGRTDGPVYFLILEVDGHKLTVEDYDGLWAGMPTIVRHLEDAVDRVSGAEQWIGTESQRRQRRRYQ